MATGAARRAGGRERERRERGRRERKRRKRERRGSSRRGEGVADGLGRTSARSPCSKPFAWEREREREADTAIAWNAFT
jgi:hypothetical protein